MALRHSSFIPIKESKNTLKCETIQAYNSNINLGANNVHLWGTQKEFANVIFLCVIYLWPVETLISNGEHAYVSDKSKSFGLKLWW